VVFITEYSYIANTFGQLSVIFPQINSGYYTHDILLGIDKFFVFGKWKAPIIGLSHTFHFKESGFDIVIPTVLVFVLWTAFIVYKLRGGAKKKNTYYLFYDVNFNPSLSVHIFGLLLLQDRIR
jgi:hypothetical protein